MDISSLLYLVGAGGFFSSRAFIPAFCTAALIRYGHMVPFVDLTSVPFIQPSGVEPTWFTNNWTLMALAGLSVLEIGATKIPEAQEVLDGVQKYTKTGVAALAAMGLLGVTDVSFIENTISQAGITDMSVAAIFGGVVFVLNSLRSGFMDVLAMADPDDDLGVRTLISWFEDLWSSFGVFLLILYPLFIITVLGLIVGLFYAVRKRAEYREEKSKTTCTSCGELTYACATECPKCHTPLEAPKNVGFLGQTIDKPAQPGKEHEFRLITKRRCPKCAGRVAERRLPQDCPTCQHPILGDSSDQSAYTGKVRNRLPKVLGVSFILSLIPILGVIPGIIYYRVQLIAPFRAYIPAGRGFVLKWLIKLVFLVLITLQIIPGLGGFMVPIMALLSYSLYSSSFNKSFKEPAA